MKNTNFLLALLRMFLVLGLVWGITWAMLRAWDKEMDQQEKEAAYAVAMQEYDNYLETKK